MLRAERLRFAGVVALLLCLAACGPKSMSARRSHSQKLADEADEQLSAAERSMGELDADEAQKAVSAAKKVLADPDAQLYPEYDMLLSRAKEDEAKLPDVKKARELKDLQAAVGQRREKVEAAYAELKKTLKALEAPAVEQGAVDDSQKALDAALDALKDGADLEKRDKAYADHAKAKRDALDKLKEPIALAKARVDFMEGPVALRDKAVERFKSAKGEKVQADKRTGFGEAKKLYEQCQEACRKALTANPAVSRLPILAMGKKTTPEALDTACSAEWQDVDKAEKKLKPEKAPVAAPAPKKKKK